MNHKVYTESELRFYSRCASEESEKKLDVAWMMGLAQGLFGSNIPILLVVMDVPNLCALFPAAAAACLILKNAKKACDAINIDGSIEIQLKAWNMCGNDKPLK